MEEVIVLFVEEVLDLDQVFALLATHCVVEE